MQGRQLKTIGQGIQVETYKEGGVKSHFDSSKQMSPQISNNNNYATTSGSPNPYISRQLNNMDQAQVIKREQEDRTRTYHKMLKGIETMIDVQRMIKDIKKLAEEVNTVVTEMEETIL